VYSNSPEFVESPRFQVDIKFVPLKLASSVSVSDVAFGDSKNPNRVAFGQSDYDYMEYLVYLNDDFSSYVHKFPHGDGGGVFSSNYVLGTFNVSLVIVNKLPLLLRVKLVG